MQYKEKKVINKLIKNILNSFYKLYTVSMFEKFRAGFPKLEFINAPFQKLINDCLRSLNTTVYLV